jgi:lysophospholipase L1-like esterase
MSQRPVYQTPQSYYLALGDSIAYGFQPPKASAGLPPSAFDTGYVDFLAARLRALAPEIRVVDYACLGESTKTFIAGRCPGRTDVKWLHDAVKGAQLQAALAFLQAHRGQVSPITLTLWGNDLGEIVDA